MSDNTDSTQIIERLQIVMQSFERIIAELNKFIRRLIDGATDCFFQFICSGVKHTNTSIAYPSTFSHKLDTGFDIF